MTLIFKGRNRVTSAFELPERPDHHGLDIVGDDSHDILCPVAGVVRSSTIITDKTSSTWEWGNYVRVDDGEGNRLFFCHMATRAVSVGQRVNPGDKLGVMGNTGYSDGAHTHFEVRKSDGRTRLNPADYLGIPNKRGTYTMEEAKSGWQQLSGSWYYYKSGAALKAQWLKDTDGRWYYLGPDGRMLTGVQRIGGKLYMLNPKRAEGIPTGACIITDGSGAVQI